MQNKTKREIVAVHWEDSYGHTGQKPEEEWKDYGTGFCVSVGMLLAEDEKQITLAQDLFYDQPPTVEGDQFRNVVSIPKSCIVEAQKFAFPIDYSKNQKREGASQKQ